MLLVPAYTLSDPPKKSVNKEEYVAACFSCRMEQAPVFLDHIFTSADEQCILYSYLTTVCRAVVLETKVVVSYCVHMLPHPPHTTSWWLQSELCDSEKQRSNISKQDGINKQICS